MGEEGEREGEGRVRGRGLIGWEVERAVITANVGFLSQRAPGGGAHGGGGRTARGERGVGGSEGGGEGCSARGVGRMGGRRTTNPR